MATKIRNGGGAAIGARTSLSATVALAQKAGKHVRTPADDVSDSTRRSASPKTQAAAPLVGIIMGSDSDWPTMKLAAEACAEFGVPCEARVVSAHRTPDDMARYAKTAAGRGLKVVIAGAGGAAHLPGMVASHTPLPVIGVPIQSKALHGLDSLLSIVQMPAGVPVATVAIGNGRNAGLLAVKILATSDARLRQRLREFITRLARESRAKNQNLQASPDILAQRPVP